MDEYTEQLITTLRGMDNAYSTTLLEKAFEVSRGEWSWENEESLNTHLAKIKDYTKKLIFLNLSDHPILIDVIGKYGLDAYLPE